MNEQAIEIYKLGNGMTLVTEAMPEVSSASFVFLVPTGAACDPENLTGTTAVLSEELFRGAGAMDNRGLNGRLEGLGLHRQNAVGQLHCSFAGALVSDNLLDVIELYADIIRRPALAEEQFEPCRQLALQGLDSLEDDPRQKISLLLQEQFLPYPLGRWPDGKREELLKLTNQAVKGHWASRFSPQGAILAAAGKLDVPRLRGAVEKYFGDWQGDKPDQPDKGQPQSKTYHQPYDGAQVHIGLMYPSVGYEHQDYYRALAAAAILSDGMGSRLFTEVREKRGLCYAVGARHQVIAGQGAVRCYLGSTPDKAQQALDVTLRELGKLAEGITQDELDRAKVGLRASLIMQGESTSARAAGCVGDFYHLGRVRSLGEIEEAVLQLSTGEIIEHVRENQPGHYAAATIGPKELKINQ